MIALSLWAKVTSTLALLIAILISYLYISFFRREKHQNARTNLNIAALAFGLILFVLTWTLVSTLLWGSGTYLQVLKAPWSAIHTRIAEPSYLSKLLATGYETFRLCIWFSPYLLLMWLIISWRVVRKKPQVSNSHEILKILLVCTTIFYFFGYLMIGGTNWGYPRYHNGILPFLCMFVGKYTYGSIIEINKNLQLQLLIILILSVAITAYFLREPLLFLNLRLKEFLLSGNGFNDVVKNALMVFIPFYGLPVLLFLFWVFISKIRSNTNVFAICLILCLLGTLLSLDIQQIFASYRTSNQYGAIGKVQVLQKVRNHINDGQYVFATPEFIYELQDKRVPDVGWNIWESKDIFYRFIELNAPQAIIAGFTVNTYGQLKWLLNKDTEQILNENYNLIRIGTYYLWLRSHDANTSY